MKKIIFIFVLLFSFSLCNAAESRTVTTTIPDSLQLTTMKVYNDIKAGLTGLSTSLKAPIEKVYSILIKQQIVKSITDSILIVFGFLLCICLFKLSKSSNGNDFKEICFVFSTIVFTVSIIAFIVLLNDIVTGFVNPNYGAIHDIINFVK